MIIEMYNHASDDYACPFCLLLQGIKNENVPSVPTDISFSSKFVRAFINSINGRTIRKMN
jgi:histidine triad (HIT) family protein